jgi:uncharacterized protein (TIGR03086 family)
MFLSEREDPMDTLTKLQAGIDQARPIIAAVSKEDYSLPTPCPDWNVGQLINHMLGALVMFRDVGNEGEADPALFTRDLIGDDATSSFDTYSRAAIAAWSAEGKIEGTAKLPFGEFPATFALQLPATDMVVHGWDLAKATGQHVDWNAALIADTMNFCQATYTREFRASDPTHSFGAAVNVPDPVDDVTRLVAFLGRQP